MSENTLKLILTAVDRASGPLKDVEKAIGNVDKKTGIVGKGFQAFEKIAVASLIAVGAAAITLGVGIGTIGINTAAQLESAEVGFATLLGSADKASSIMERIKQEAKRTPFELTGLTSSTQLLTSITKDGDKSLDTILNVGEGLAAMGKGQVELDRIIVNLQQIGATGRATMMDIRQFGYNGIPIFELLQKETGLTGEALGDFISNGGVTFDMLSTMFDKANDKGGMFFEAYKNQAGTFNQLLSNTKDSIGIFSSDIVKQTGLFDLAKEGLAGFTQGLTDNQDEIINFVNGAVTKLGKAFQWISINVFPKVEAVFNYFKDSVIPALVDVWDNILLPALKQLWGVVETQLMPALINLKDRFMEFWNVISPYVIPALQIVAVIIGAVIIGAILLLIGALTLMANIWSWILGVVTWVITGIIDWINFLKGIFEGVMNFMNADANTKAYMIGQFFGNAVSFIINKFTEAKDWVIAKFTEIGASAQALPAQFSQWFEQIKTDISNKITEAKNNIVNTFNSLKDVNLSQIGADMINGLINGIKGKAEEVKNTVSNMANSIKDGFANAMQIKSPSRVFKYFGEMTGLGFDQGLQDSMVAPAKTLSNLVPDTKPSVTNNQASSTAGLASSGVTIQKVEVNIGSYMGTEKDKRSVADELADAMIEAIKKRKPQFN